MACGRFGNFPSPVHSALHLTMQVVWQDKRVRQGTRRMEVSRNDLFSLGKAFRCSSWKDTQCALEVRVMRQDMRTHHAAASKSSGSIKQALIDSRK